MSMLYRSDRPSTAVELDADVIESYEKVWNQIKGDYKRTAETHYFPIDLKQYNEQRFSKWSSLQGSDILLASEATRERV